MTRSEFECSVVETGQVGKVRARGRVGSEMLDRAVGCEDPAVSQVSGELPGKKMSCLPVFVLTKARSVVDVHLESGVST